MGGKNPVVVLEDCDIDLAVEHTAQGTFGSTGQRCTATSRAVVMESIADKFVEKIVARAKSFRLGDGSDPSTDIGPSVDESQFNTVMSYIDIGREDGAILLCGGKKAEAKVSKTGILLSRPFSITSRRICVSRARRSSDRCYRCFG